MISSRSASPRMFRRKFFCSIRVSVSFSLWTDSSSNSVAPLIEVSGDFSSWVRCAEKVAM